MLVNPCCRCPRSSKGITAAFLYWLGYRLSTSSMSFSFCALNLKGIDRLFSGESRCYSRHVSMLWQDNARCFAPPYHIEGCGPLRRRDLKASPLRFCGAPKSSCTAAKRPGRKSGRHGGCGGRIRRNAPFEDAMATDIEGAVIGWVQQPARALRLLLHSLCVQLTYITAAKDFGAHDICIPLRYRIIQGCRGHSISI